MTIVFANLVGSTAVRERPEPESARRFMESCCVAMRRAVESQVGCVTQLLGEAVPVDLDDVEHAVARVEELRATADGAGEPG